MLSKVKEDEKGQKNYLQHFDRVCWQKEKMLSRIQQCHHGHALFPLWES